MIFTDRKELNATSVTAIAMALTAGSIIAPFVSIPLVSGFVATYLGTKGFFKGKIDDTRKKQLQETIKNTISKTMEQFSIEDYGPVVELIADKAKDEIGEVGDHLSYAQLSRLSLIIRDILADEKLWEERGLTRRDIYNLTNIFFAVFLNEISQKRDLVQYIELKNIATISGDLKALGLKVNILESELAALKKHPDAYLGTSDQEVTIGIIVALPEELAAMKALVDNVTELSFGGGAGNRFFIGEIPSVNGRIRKVALTLMVSMGNNIAAVYATSLISHFPHVQSIIMTGIAGGIPDPANPHNHVRLGDIVLSGERGVVQYDFVKETWENVEPRFPPRPPSAAILEAVRYLQAEEYAFKFPWRTHLDCCLKALNEKRPDDSLDRLYSIDDDKIVPHPFDSKRTGYPKVFVGGIASSNTLLKNPKKRDLLRTQHHVLAVEMEGSGIADATWIQNHVGYFLVRGICDYCDSHKNDTWHVYAAAVAASYTRALIENIPANC